MSYMATTTVLQVRLDAELDRMVDELNAYYGKQASELDWRPTGSFGRSDTVRVILRAAHRDMKDKLAGRP